MIRRQIGIRPPVGTGRLANNNVVVRGVQYIRLITHLNLAYGMALEYGEPGRRAIRGCCKFMIASGAITDAKVLMLARAAIESKAPEEVMIKLTDDLNRHAIEQNITYEGLAAGAGSF